LAACQPQPAPAAAAAAGGAAVGLQAEITRR
jgi:hypothetical protein